MFCYISLSITEDPRSLWIIKLLSHPYKSIPTRTTLLLSADRFHNSWGQWKDRGDVWKACNTSSFCTPAIKTVELEKNSTFRTKGKDVERPQFIELVSNSKFVIVIHGGSYPYLLLFYYNYFTIITIIIITITITTITFTFK